MITTILTPLLYDASMDVTNLVTRIENLHTGLSINQTHLSINQAIQFNTSINQTHRFGHSFISQVHLIEGSDLIFLLFQPQSSLL